MPNNQENSGMSEMDPIQPSASGKGQPGAVQRQDVGNTGQSSANQGVFGGNGLTGTGTSRQNIDDSDGSGGGDATARHSESENMGASESRSGGGAAG